YSSAFIGGCTVRARRRSNHGSTAAGDRPSPHPARAGRCFASPSAGDPPPPGEGKKDPSAPASLRGHVFSVLHGEDDARAVVEAVAVFFSEVIDALARRELTFGQK